MNLTKKMRIHFLNLLSILVILSNSGCSMFEFLTGNPGVRLSYKFPDNQKLKYSLSNKFNQNIEVNGRSIQAISNTNLIVSFRKKGVNKNLHNLSVTIEDIKIQVQGPQGEIIPDLSSINDKVFEMNLSNFGKESNFKGADAIRFRISPAGEQSVISNFQTFFPDLALKPLHIGDTWTSYDTIKINEQNPSLLLTFKKYNALKGFEEIKGHNCAKIIAEIKGELTGTGKQMGNLLTLIGKITGNDVWYFCAEKGVLVKMESNCKIRGKIITRGVQNISIPMGMQMNLENELLE